MNWKIIGIEKSILPKKKWTAFFYNKANDKAKTVHFGQAGAEDYTIHGDATRAERYRARHKKDLIPAETKGGMTPGALSYYVLWSSPSFSQGVRNYKNKYNL